MVSSILSILGWIVWEVAARPHSQSRHRPRPASWSICVSDLHLRFSCASFLFLRGQREDDEDEYCMHPGDGVFNREAAEWRRNNPNPKMDALIISNQQNRPSEEIVRPMISPPIGPSKCPKSVCYGNLPGNSRETRCWGTSNITDGTGDAID